MAVYRLFPSTSGPANPTNFGPGFEFVSAVGFQVTEMTTYFQGYWWWVCPTQQSTAPQKFCLWQDTRDLDTEGDQGAVVEASVITSGALTPGQWNYITLPEPIPLSQYVSYRAATASPQFAPTTNNPYGAGGTYDTGITSGPLFAFADSSSGNTADVSFYQGNNCSWQYGTLDPTSVYPGLGSSGFNTWMDVQVTNVPPPNPTYRCWPNQPNPLYTPEAQLPFTVSTQLAVSQRAQILKLWFMSQTGNAVLPTICGIWDAQTQAVVPASVNSSPKWLLPGGGAASAGAGWVYCDYSATELVLNANHNYRVAVGMYSPGYTWYSGAQGYWLANGGGYTAIGTGYAHGAGNGIIACVPCGLSPNPATPCAQDTSGTWAYPNSVEADGDNYYIDLEVAPVSVAKVNSGAFLAFFP